MVGKFRLHVRLAFNTFKPASLLFWALMWTCLGWCWTSLDRDIYSLKNHDSFDCSNQLHMKISKTWDFLHCYVASEWPVRNFRENLARLERTKREITSRTLPRNCWDHWVACHWVEIVSALPAGGIADRGNLWARAIRKSRDFRRRASSALAAAALAFCYCLVLSCGKGWRLVDTRYHTMHHTFWVNFVTCHQKKVLRSLMFPQILVIIWRKTLLTLLYMLYPSQRCIYIFVSIDLIHSYIYIYISPTRSHMSMIYFTLIYICFNQTVALGFARSIRTWITFRCDDQLEALSFWLGFWIAFIGMPNYALTARKFIYGTMVMQINVQDENDLNGWSTFSGIENDHVNPIAASDLFIPS